MGSPFERKLTWRGAVACCGCFFVVFSLANYTSAFLVLFCYYGFCRVWIEGLSFIAMPPLAPWRVSNGDLIAEATILRSLFAVSLTPILFSLLFIAASRIFPCVLFVKQGGNNPNGWNEEKWQA